MAQHLSRSERETLKAVYRLNKGDDAAHTGDLAERLEVAPSTVTTTVKRLADRGLVEHELYRGVRLTKAGRQAAVATIRRHRIVERFLADMLGYAWDQADRLSVAFEHSLPNEVVARLYAALNRPETCPHGFPIPDKGAEEVPSLRTLADLEAGEEVDLALPGDLDDEVRRFLPEIGIRPGVRARVREKHPFDGPIVVSVDGVDRTIGVSLARLIYTTSGKE
jgi:DtxR family transcriptional regulator, Mn-dependent transcriptional regulator